MDPMHPALHDAQEQLYDRHYQAADERRKAIREAESTTQRDHTPAEYDLPEFDPSAVLARVTQ